ncbi:SDR family oxidoreductase [Microlunatus elymi]|uniref:SDR family oxidoreductase n=1 Tax=Microlunatus elymi TaxID=2596828 RepID=A0A516PUH8_9ACTN|nr:SDR family oxidoreductase [Microlunatus elymi]QDP94848.1 SDR family oxidoreductase [Microlunatus elymi]
MATALITGGTSGIGAAFAQQLAAKNYDLVLVARDETRLKETADELHTGFGVEVETISADLADRHQVLQVAARLADQDRPIDVLINNAGFGVHSKLLDPDTSRQEVAVDVMIRAVLLLSNAAGRAMRERGSGGILNVSSTAGFMTMGLYSAVKAWVTTYTESLAGELHGSGVRVTALLPGWVRTEFHQRAGINASKIPDPLWLDAEPLVRQALIDFDRGKVLSMPSTRYKILMGIAQRAPRGAIHAVSRMLSSSRHS